MQQSAIKSLMDIMQGDMEDMKKIETELNKSQKQKHWSLPEVQVWCI